MKRRSALSLTIAALALSSCLGNSGSPTPAPTGVRVYGGDSAVSVTWNDDPTVSYWVFHAQDPTVSPLNWENLAFAGVIPNAQSPSILCGQINNPPSQFLSSFTEIYFSINGRTGTAPGGVGSGAIGVTPRPAGGPDAPWVPGGALPANTNINAIGYAPQTPCGSFGRPPWGIYIAVGPSGTVYYSDLQPNVAGALVPSAGNATMTWYRGTVPTGYNGSLNGVAAVNSSAYTGPGGILIVAVGKSGAILRSVDGQNWEAVYGPTTEDLNAIANAGGSFVAVGNNGTVITSADGLNWSIDSTVANADPASDSFNAIQCAGGNCVAVGANGATLWTGSAGNGWTLVRYGTNNWTSIAFGNFDANADAVVTPSTGAITLANEGIQTWLVMDSQGNNAHAYGTGGWIANTQLPGTIVAVDYTTRFVALDSGGNAYFNELGFGGWTQAGYSGINNAVALKSNGMGFVAIATDGTNASSF